jgi:hypothetical protein
MGLSDRDRSILDFERTWWTQDGPKENAIRSQFELSPTRYYQLLNQLLDDPGAQAYDPLVVRRLRKLRTERRRARFVGHSVGQHPGR